MRTFQGGPFSLCLFLLSLTVAPGALAQNSFYMGLGLGGGDVDISESVIDVDEFSSADLAGDSVLVSELFFGMQFANDALVELAIDDYDSFSLFIADKVRFNSTRLTMGYAPQPKGRIGFVGKLGLAFWELDVNESPLFNPGSESRLDASGTALYLQIGGEFHATKRTRIGAVFDFSDTDAGDNRSLKLQLRYLFGR